MPPAPAPEPTPGMAADRAKDDKAAEPAKDDEKPKDKAATDQAYWSNRLKTLQTQLDRDQDFADALQTRINALTTDFVNRDDPAQRAVIGANRDKALAELDRLKQAIADRQEGDRRPPGRSAPRGRSARLAAVSVRSRRAADPPVLLVEDKDSLRAMLRLALEAQGHTVVEARDQPEAAAALLTTQSGVVLSDLRLPDGDGFGVLRAAKELDPELPVIVMTAFGSIQDAVAAMKEGALDFLAKPVDPDHLLLMVERALAQRRLATENILLKEELAQRRGAPQIVGDDAEAEAGHRCSCIARRPPTSTVLLEGESGTGKELFARALHALSPRADGPFVAINCAAIPENLLETELFGHEKGAFTGAAARKPGKFELAHRGTLFLDEIGDLPLALQAKILRALEEKRFERVGGTVPLQVDVRVVAATNRNLKAAVAARQYREDLYFRLSVFPITIPPLRDRAADIPMLAQYFIERFCRDLNKRPLTLAPAAADELCGLSVAGQRPRAAELHRARGDSHRRRHDPPAPSEPVVPRRAGCRARRRRRGAVVEDRPVRHAGRGVAPRDRRGRAAEDRAGAEGGGRQPRAGGRDAAGQLQDAAAQAEGARLRVPERGDQPQLRESRPALSAGSQLLLRHVVDDRRRADRRRQHEVQPSGDDLLVVLHRFEDLRRRQVGDRRQRAEAGDQVGERLAIALGERAARDRQLAPPRACRRRPLRRGGSGGIS